MPWLHKNHYYNLHAEHKFCIKLDDITIFKQKCARTFNDIASYDSIFDDLIKNEKKTIQNITEAIKDDCSFSKAKKENKMFNDHYKKQKYLFMESKTIYAKVSMLIMKHI